MKNRRLILSTTVIAWITATVFLGQGCQGPNGTSTGNPVSSEPGVSMKIAAFNPTVAPGSVVNSLTLCFKRLRFKAAPGSTDSGNIDLALGEVTLQPSGTNLSSATIPNGTFSRIEFDLDTSCASGHSVALTNSSGSFVSTDGMTIRFDGTITISDGDGSVDLLIQQIVDALASVANGGDIKNAAESVSGSF